MALSARDAYRVMFKEFPDVVDVNQMSQMLGISTKTSYRLLQERSAAHTKFRSCTFWHT